MACEAASYKRVRFPLCYSRSDEGRKFFPKASIRHTCLVDLRLCIATFYDILAERKHYAASAPQSGFDSHWCHFLSGSLFAFHCIRKKTMNLPQCRPSLKWGTHGHSATTSFIDTYEGVDGSSSHSQSIMKVFSLPSLQCLLLVQAHLSHDLPQWQSKAPLYVSYICRL